MKIGEKFKEFRIRNHFKQNKLADELYISKYTMCRIETNQMDASDMFLFIWKTKFCINEKWLLSDNEPMVVVPMGRDNYLPVLPSTVKSDKLRDKFEYFGFVEITSDELKNLNHSEIIVIQLTNRQPFMEIDAQVAVSLSFDKNQLNGIYLVSYQNQLSFVELPSLQKKAFIYFNNKAKEVLLSDLEIIGQQIRIDSVDSPKAL
jgi:DNA-binding XRE family transcriptional regulator